MKAKNIIIVQVLLLVGAIVAGTLLKGNLADGPRTVHRMFGLLAAVAGLTSAIVITMKGTKTAPKVLLWVAAAFTFLAGYAGHALKITSDYDRTFMTMRGSAVVALILAVIVLAMTHKNDKD